MAVSSARLSSLMTPTQLVEALMTLDNPDYWLKELTTEYRRVGSAAAGWASSGMSSHSERVVQKSSDSIRGSSTRTSARVVLGGNEEWPAAVASVFGTRRKTGWYGGWYKGQVDPAIKERFANGPPNHPPWIGTNWTIGVKGQGPRGINDGLSDRMGQLQDMFADSSMRTLNRAFK